jgi:hypothetical protein
MFLCNQETENECLRKQMVGTTAINYSWCMNIQAGDDIYLFNFNTGVVRGPYTATSTADCHDPAAWQGKFPVQVRIAATPVTRQADNRDVNAPAILRKRRPSGALDTVASELFTWLRNVGVKSD